MTSASKATTTTRTIIPWLVKSRSNTAFTILVPLELFPSVLVLMVLSCPRMTAPTTSKTPTMTTPRTVPVKAFNCPRRLSICIGFHLRSSIA